MKNPHRKAVLRRRRPDAIIQKDYLLYQSSDSYDRHHVDAAVANLVTGVGCVYYLTASDIDSDVTAITAAGVPADDIARSDIFTSYIDSAAGNRLRKVRNRDTDLPVCVNDESRTVNTACRLTCPDIINTEHCFADSYDTRAVTS